jgi:hypothetical protein
VPLLDPELLPPLDPELPLEPEDPPLPEPEPLPLVPEHDETEPAAQVPFSCLHSFCTVEAVASVLSSAPAQYEHWTALWPLLPPRVQHPS